MRVRVQGTAKSRYGAGLLVAAALVLPVRAEAQYTLSFAGSSQFSAATICPGGFSIGCTVSDTYGSVAGVVDVENGTIKTFGAATTKLKNDFVIGAGSDVGENAANGDIGYIDATGTNVGVFDFSTVVPTRFFTLDSLRVGLSSAAACTSKAKSCVNGGAVDYDVELYNDDNELLWDSGDISIAPGTSELITPPAAFAANVQGGAFLEFAPVDGLSNAKSSYFSVDNVTYEVASFTPEPGAMALLGTGLAVLVPLSIRRKRKTA
ncbi:MAG TPA: hypothetical protein VHW65_06455 [Gemmatimonadales bacterium]|nr:hypothetical protein [Gemmatimonadales bacterium]